MSFRIEPYLTAINFTDKNSTARIKYIVIHYFGSLGTAKQVAKYFASAYRGASAHYTLDEGETVYQCVDDGDIAWHCGTTGKYYHRECRNSNSIGIEVRPHKLDPSTYTRADCTDWYINEETEARLVEFTAYLMKKYNIPLDHVVRHYDVTHKWCPRPYMGDDVNDYYGHTGNQHWAMFKQRLDTYLKKGSVRSTVTYEQFKSYMDRWLNEQQLLDGADWSAEARLWALDNGLIAGCGRDASGKMIYAWKSNLTREQFVVIMQRFYEKFYR